VYKKYFIAIVLPPPVFEEAEKIKHELYLTHSLKGALRSPAHITLHRPFEWKEEKENTLIEKLNTFKFPGELQIELNNFSFFEHLSRQDQVKIRPRAREKRNLKHISSI